MPSSLAKKYKQGAAQTLGALDVPPLPNGSKPSSQSSQEAQSLSTRQLTHVLVTIALPEPPREVSLLASATMRLISRVN